MVILLLLTTHVFLGVEWFLGRNHLSVYDAKWQKVLPDRRLLDSINTDTADLKKKINILTDMTIKKSVLWSPKFNAISDDIPKGLWIRRMLLDKTGLTLEGSVVSKNESEINKVGLFLSALKLNDRFMKDFSSLEVNSIQRSKDNAVEVADFTVMAKLNETRSK